MNAKKTTHPQVDNVVMKLLILISKILNDFSSAEISVKVFKVVLVYKETTLLPWELYTC